MKHIVSFLTLALAMLVCSSLAQAGGLLHHHRHHHRGQAHIQNNIIVGGTTAVVPGASFAPVRSYGCCGGCCGGTAAAIVQQSYVPVQTQRTIVQQQYVPVQQQAFVPQQSYAPVQQQAQFYPQRTTLPVVLLLPRLLQLLPTLPWLDVPPEPVRYQEQLSLRDTLQWLPLAMEYSASEPCNVTGTDATIPGSS
jgi:hypothetical protein